MLERPSVDTVVGGVEAAFGEPDDVAGGEGAGFDGVEGAVPVQGFAGGLRNDYIVSEWYEKRKSVE